MSEQWQTVVPNQVDSETWDREGTVQGIFTTKKTNVGPNDSNIYILKTKDKDISIWGSAVLDSRFEQIPLRSEVRVTGLGKVTSEKTGRSYYDYTVEFRPAPFVTAGNDPQEAGEKSSKDGDSEPPIEDRENQDEVNVDDLPF